MKSVTLPNAQTDANLLAYYDFPALGYGSSYYGFSPYDSYGGYGIGGSYGGYGLG